MASLALSQVRGALSPLRTTFARGFLAATLLPSAWAASKPFTLAPPSLQTLLELLPPWVLAVPKKKTSHSRKAMRSANKGLKDKQNVVACPACGTPKLAHHLCASCYSGLSRGWKSKAKEDVES
ncbi:hypothetical protein QCA50_001801 [Cerrena zonata]|uniref:Large ribosomal subunit protein bL32m n=1 Tax=Cerrena zonata TaxID=2478898 RepID=A0AAW0GXZ9_9APHY